jgi:ABC-type glycerol-3-phosphate transport system permease component
MRLAGRFRSFRRDFPLVPLIQFLQQIKLYGTLCGLIAFTSCTGLPITSLIFQNYFANIPDELMEVARIDGRSHHPHLYQCHVPHR